MTPEESAALIAAINALTTAITDAAAFDQAVFELVLGKALLMFVIGLGVGFVISLLRKMRA